jgi:Flp pilus assembly protein TadG
LKNNNSTISPKTAKQLDFAILVLFGFALVALFGFAAIAVDLAQLYQVNAHLQLTASSAAAAAALDLPDDSAASATALHYAELNMPADEHGDVLSAADVEFGNWNDSARQFTVDGTPVNAVRVTTRRDASSGNAVGALFGRLLGVVAHDLSATATAKILPLIPGAIGAAGSITISGNVTIDSYDSTQGPYDPATAGDDGDIAAGGDVSIGGRAEINGTVRGATVSSSGNATTGGTSFSRRSMEFPSVDISGAQASNNNSNLPLIMKGNKLASPLDASGNFSLTGGEQYNMPPGVYLFNDLSLGGQSSISISGPTDIYLTGDLDTSGGDVINSTQDPNNLRIFMTGGNAQLNASVDWYGLLYAPDSEVTINGSADVYGAIIGANVTASGSGEIHFDAGLELGDDLASQFPKRSALVQ